MTPRPPIRIVLDSNVRNGRHPNDHGRVDACGDDNVARPTRRSVVQWLAASMALAASGCSEHPRGTLDSYAHMPEIAVNGTPLYYASACLRDGFAQGVLVATQQGRPVKVEGNPGHPASLGGTDVFAQAEILQLWDPDRSRNVVRRSTDGRSEPSSWPAFMKAWRERPAGAVHVLAGPSTSPTESAGLARLLGGDPGSRWYLDDRAGGAGERAAAQAAFGRPVRWVRHFDRTTLIVSFGADPFSEGPAAVRQAADWARARGDAIAAGRRPPTLVALETMPGLFGARADERLALSPPQIEAALWLCARRLLPALATASTNAPAPGTATGAMAGQGAAMAVSEDAAASAAAERLAQLLERHRGAALLCGADWLSVPSQALLHALAQRFGSDGAIEAIAPPEEGAASLPPPGSLRDLLQAVDHRSVDTLLVLGANPVYTSADGAALAAAMAKVPLGIHFGSHRDETAASCGWHLPCGHVFEQWGDARAFDGSATVLQPVITPLYDTRSPIELLALLAGEPAPDGRALVHAQWKALAGGAGAAGASDFDDFWRRSLRDGVIAGSRSAPLALPPARLPQWGPDRPAPAADAIWGLFPSDASVLDGSHANNGWLQELPRPFTKITWGNALHLGPETARTLGLKTGDLARVRRIDQPAGGIEAPVWVLPGHAERSATLPRGYGRRAAGGIGDQVGVDNAPLRSATPGAVALVIERSGDGHVFAVTQVETDQQDRDLARVIDGAALAAAHGQGPSPSAANPTLYPPVALQGAAWGMAIDLDACIGCNVCTIACQAENNIPVVGPAEIEAGRVMHWIRVDAYRDEADRVLNQPVTCMHCENAPCELVCPVGATVHDSEGLNVQVYNRCVGTRFCSNNCPYKVRRFNFRQYSDVRTEIAKLMHNPDVTVRSRGVMEKCSYCVQRISRARREEQKTGQPNGHDEVRTACQSACPTGAIHFGDLNDPHSDVVQAKASPRHYVMLGELNTRPRTTYLARVGALPKEES